MAQPIGVPAAGARAPGADPPPFDTTVPHPSPMYDYLLAGKDSFEADPEAAEELVAISPATRRAVRENRSSHGRAVRYLAGEAGSGSSSTSAPASPPPTTPTRWPSGWPPDDEPDVACYGGVGRKSG
jgi:hypothetical protein